MPGGQRTLLAKGPTCRGDPREEETLVGHTRAVLASARAILASLGNSVSSTFGLSKEDTVMVKNSLLRAALLHDLGKASSQFQGVVWGERRGEKQALRHEWISAWLPLRDEAFARWLFGGDDELMNVTLCAVLGHHLKVGDGCSITPREGTGDIRVRCHWGHPDFATCLRTAGDLIGLSPDVPVLEDTEIDLLGSPLVELREWLSSEWDGGKCVPITKALLMAADIAGSAVPARSGWDMHEWVGSTLGRRCTTPGLRNIAQNRLSGRTLRAFQARVRDLPHRVILVRAGCGTGKTVAAYLWAAARAEGRKLFISYPTTGTATEGYRDYVIPSEMEPDSALLHSRSEIDIEYILEGEAGTEVEAAGLGIAALVSWDVPVTVCTTDTVLGIIQNSRLSLYSSPASMNAAFVFDEIHQYDHRLWGALLRFVEAYRGAPVLLMTASLPRHRLDTLRNLLGGELAVVEGPEDLERIERYRLFFSKEIPWNEMGKVLHRGGKVLWVCNTVSRCVERGREAEERWGGEVVLSYHSRFRYVDRLKHHEEVINAFRSDRPALVVATQVCEVSLDISADLLVTDLAPIPALIQRLGRLNRRVIPGAATSPCDAFLLKPASASPYDDSDLEAAQAWLRQLAGQPVSQRNLVEVFEGIAEDGEEGRVSSAWLDGGKCSEQAPLRETGYTIPMLREEDFSAANGKPMRRFVVQYEIPMPWREVADEVGRWKRIYHARVVPRGRMEYEEKWGARWTKGTGG